MKPGTVAYVRWIEGVPEQMVYAPDGSTVSRGFYEATYKNKSTQKSKSSDENTTEEVDTSTPTESTVCDDNKELPTGEVG